MSIRKAAKRLACVCALTVATTQAATVNGTVNFLGGVLGTWSISFTSSAPQVELQKVVITLPATYGFDTQGGGFGLLTSQDFFKVSGGATASALTPATQAARDGASQIAIDFTGFNATAGTFLFLLDVDGAAPVLETCASGLAGLACRGRNAAAVVLASTVDGAEMAGTSSAFTFGGAGYDSLTLPAGLARTGDLTGGGSFSGVITPEPATFALMGLGLAGLVFLSRRRR